ncbi:MAG: hypothetical protein H8E85_05365 [Candidatus Marinimicrobia bacterium]|nr:hypothetical protein [Candidatus Neomarinimicrobiota bacterium]
MTIADFNPSILFLLLWGLLSWFTKKKKKEVREIDFGTSKTVQEKEDLFARLKKLQDHLSSNLDILPLKPEEDYWEEDQTDFVDEAEPAIVQEPQVIYPENEEIVWDRSTPLVAEPQQVQTIKRNWLFSIMSDKNNIKKAIILNEILGEPRGLKPY